MMKSRINLIFINMVLGVLGIIYAGLRPIHYKLTLYKRCRYQFKPREDDIFVVTFPKSGTTWLQAILYQLTTDGNMNFSNISDVCPFFADWRNDDFNKMASPRIFKSHLAYGYIPSFPARYI